MTNAVNISPNDNSPAASADAKGGIKKIQRT